MKWILALAAGAAMATVAAQAEASSLFLPGNLVVAVSGAGVPGIAVGAPGPYTDNQASPLTLFQYSLSGTSSASYVNNLVLPQSSSGGNSAISAEYGSSSEGMLQLTGNGKALTIMGYGVDAASFNGNPTAYGTTVNDPTKPDALAQSGSLLGQSYTPISRVVGVIHANGDTDTTTQLYGVFNGNNPRSVYSADGSSFYVSGQGHSPDATGGVFYATAGAHTATAITGLDTNGKTSSQDTRDVQIVNGQLTVSVDSKEGSGSNRDFIGTLGAAGSPPTTLANSGNGPTRLAGFGNSGGTGKFTLNANTANGVNSPGQEINLSPEQFFMASSTVMYVADSGMPKNDSVTNDKGSISTLGDGGLQKWVLVGGTWTLEYTVSAGLGLVANTGASGTTGLFGLTGKVVNGQVELYATNFTIGDTDQTYLYGLTDTLASLAPAGGEGFTQLAAAPGDSRFRGLAFAPTPEPSTWALLILGVGLMGVKLRRRPRAATTAA